MPRGTYRAPPRKRTTPDDKLQHANATDGVMQPVDLQMVEKLAALGLSQRQLAAYFRVSVTKWYLQRRDWSGIAAAWQRGRARGVAIVASRLMRNIDSGDTASILFYVKCRADWAPNGEAIDGEAEEIPMQTPVVILPADIPSFAAWEQSVAATPAPSAPAPAAEPEPTTTK